MKLGLFVKEVVPDVNNPAFTLLGYIYLKENDYNPSYVFAKGYIGMSGKNLHLDNIPTFKVSEQAELLKYVAQNEQRLLRSIKRKLKQKEAGA